MEENLKKLGILIRKLEPKDMLLKSFGGNLLLEKGKNKGLIAFIGRGLIEFTDRLRLLVSLESIKDLLFTGLAGSLSEEIITGDINIPKYVIPFENVSSFYANPSVAIPKADEDLWREVYEYSINTKVKIHSNLHATVMLFYSETIEFLNYLKSIGVYTIDMELSAFYSLSNLYGKRAVGVLRITDMPLIEYHKFSEKFAELAKKKREDSVASIFEIILKFFKMI
ncbi:phosphorylase family protein [Saccharolobus islandicus]|uniref:phosphorylase family protein n=1 Tax=Saccharolobus islandicus TaxID=43080 RepID=UPI001F4A02CF|nr:purine-nucleoside phosphorylase [Sulfolobus islandicus]